MHSADLIVYKVVLGRREIVNPISEQTPTEELANVVTHGVGLICAAVSFIVMVLWALQRSGIAHSVAVALFGVALIATYLTSMLYHYAHDDVRKRALRVLDHMSIFGLIAGSYTPYVVLALWDNDQARLLLQIVWVIAILGIVGKYLFPNQNEWISLAVYLGMGWLGAIAFADLRQHISDLSFGFLVGGGLLYSVGVIFYRWNSLPFNHAIWHLFVMGASGCHVISVLALI